MPLKLPKGKLAIGMAVAGVGVGGLYLYEKHKAASNPSSAAVSATGYGYGGYGYQNPAFSAPLEYSGGSYGYGYYGYGGEFAGLGGYGSSVPPVSAAASVATTNAGWAGAAETYMTGNTGADPATVAAALGKYITGQTVTSDQQSIIEQAIAFEGYPPTAGAGNYPPNIHTTTSSGQGGGTPAPGGGTTPAGTKQVAAPGNQDLSQFAHAHNTTGGKLIALKGNKWLVPYYATTRKIPKGYKVTIQT
jgi:hypothetical protein